MFIIVYMPLENFIPDHLFVLTWRIFRGDFDPQSLSSVRGSFDTGQRFSLLISGPLAAERYLNSLIFEPFRVTQICRTGQMLLWK